MIKIMICIKGKIYKWCIVDEDGITYPLDKPWKFGADDTVGASGWWLISNPPNYHILRFILESD